MIAVPRQIVGRNWPAAVVLALFAACAFVVPTLASVSTTDDWGYTRSVEIFRHTHDLTVLPVVAATAVFQIGWGIAFSYLFGLGLGTMRLATVTMSGIGAIGLYWLLGQLGIDRARSALGMAAYLFNPLQFILAFTFNTDPYFASLMILATAFYVRGMAADERSDVATIAGSALATAAFLTRQQGVLIPCAVVAYLILSRRLTVRSLTRTALIPIIGFVGYYLWLHFYNQVPEVQSGFLDEARAAGFAGAWTLARHLTYFEIMYCGAFVLPIILAATPFLHRARFRFPIWGWGCLAASLALPGYEFWRLGNKGWHMPYVPQFVGAQGLGPGDVIGGRPRIIEQPWFDRVTVICALSVLVAAIMIGRAVGLRGKTPPSGIGLLALVGLFQIAGILPPSFHYLRHGYSLDRYLLPLLPLSIALILWALRDIRLSLPLAWLAIASVAIADTALTRDYLLYMQTVWRAADSAVIAGAREDQVDAGAGWDGYHLYTDGLEAGLTRARTHHGRWWTNFYGKPTDSTYVVSSKPVKDYVIIGEYHYHTWLPDKGRTLFLLRRRTAPDLPALIDDTYSRAWPPRHWHD